MSLLKFFSSKRKSEDESGEAKKNTLSIEWVHSLMIPFWIHNYVVICMYICRFQNFNEKPLKSFQALDYRSVPSERHQLASHGKEDLQDILNHMMAVFPEASHSQIQTEYVQLKMLMRQQQQSSEVPVSEVYARLLRTSPSAIKWTEENWAFSARLWCWEGHQAVACLWQRRSSCPRA